VSLIEQMQEVFDTEMYFLCLFKTVRVSQFNFCVCLHHAVDFGFYPVSLFGVLRMCLNTAV